MVINDALLQNKEKIVFALRDLYSKYGYSQYRMSKFEEYDLYAGNKNFLVSDNVITFTDTDGKLMALKPDVTLSIIKNSSDVYEKVQRVYYNENVYRISGGNGSFKEIMQTGVECFGNLSDDDICEVLLLAVQSLKLLSKDAMLVLSDIGIISCFADRLQLDSAKQTELYKAIGEKNIHEIESICSDLTDIETVNNLKKLTELHGTVKQILPVIKSLIPESEYRFCRILNQLSASEFASMIYVDFSVTGDINYYNGIVFKGVLRDIPSAVLSGGQYDRLMQKMGKKSKAVGFAVYTDMLDRIDLQDNKMPDSDDEFINIALPKGRLGEKIYELFASAGFECPSILEQNRKLIFENHENKVRYFWVKPSDVPIYVEHGAADIGVAGKDILLEYEPDVYELLDLKKGKCRMAVAAPEDYTDEPSRTLRVATKFTNIAKKYYRSLGRDIDIIHLNGSIEIAPILKLSDVIVDIVETGTTLKENNLEVKETVVPISARLISNKVSYKFKFDKIKNIADRLNNFTEE